MVRNRQLLNAWLLKYAKNKETESALSKVDKNLRVFNRSDHTSVNQKDNISPNKEKIAQTMLKGHFTLTLVRDIILTISNHDKKGYSNSDHFSHSLFRHFPANKTSQQ